MDDDGWASSTRRRCNADRMLTDHQPVTPAIEFKECPLSIYSDNSHALGRCVSHAHSARCTVVDDNERLSGEDAGQGDLRGQHRIDPTSHDQADKLKAAKKTETRHETDSSHSP